MDGLGPFLFDPTSDGAEDPRFFSMARSMEASPSSMAGSLSDMIDDSFKIEVSLSSKFQSMDCGSYNQAEVESYLDVRPWGTSREKDEKRMRAVGRQTNESRDSRGLARPVFRKMYYFKINIQIFKSPVFTVVLTVNTVGRRRVHGGVADVNETGSCPSYFLSLPLQPFRLLSFSHTA